VDPVFGFPALAALMVGFVAVRRVVRRRRQSLQAYTRTRDERLKKSTPKDRSTKRAEMRAHEDPTTMMGSIRTGPRDSGRGKAKTQSKG
jgi:hypothetical protein